MGLARFDSVLPDPSVLLLNFGLYLSYKSNFGYGTDSSQVKHGSDANICSEMLNSNSSSFSITSYNTDAQQ